MIKYSSNNVPLFVLFLITTTAIVKNKKYNRKNKKVCNNNKIFSISSFNLHIHYYCHHYPNQNQVFDLLPLHFHHFDLQITFCKN